MAVTVAPPDALEIDAALRAVLDRLEVECDTDARAHLRRWLTRLELELSEALLAA